MLRLRALMCAVSVAATVTLALPAVAQTQHYTPHYDVPSALNCGNDKTVRVNTRSGIYHFQGERYFGNTKEGKFMCERDADQEGDRPTRNGQ